MSDYQDGDGRPASPLRPCTVSDEVYVYHHGGLVGLEVGPWGTSPGSSEVTVGLSAEAARYVARELVERADEVERLQSAAE